MYQNQLKNLLNRLALFAFPDDGFVLHFGTVLLDFSNNYPV